MIVYLDASAAVKRYTIEPGSAEVVIAVSRASLVATALVSGAQVPAALARATRTGALSAGEAEGALADFWRHWRTYSRLRVDEALVRHAAQLAWRFGLRGYDSMHLASALLLQDMAGDRVTFATFDRQLARAARLVGLATLPEDLDAFYASLSMPDES